MQMKETYYAVRNLLYGERLLVKVGMEVTVVEKNGKSIIFESPALDGQIPSDIFNMIFSKFQPHEIVFHPFYGIGQIVPSKKDTIPAAVQFFSEPGPIDIDDEVLLESSLSRMPNLL